MFTLLFARCAMPAAAQRRAFVDSVGGAMYCTITVPRASLPRHGSAPWHTAARNNGVRQRRLMETGNRLGPTGSAHEEEYIQ